MRWIQLALVVGCCLGLARGVAADEPAGGAEVQPAFEALTVRMEAQLRKAELLAESGRTEEALAAYDAVGKIWDDGVVLIRELLGRRAARPGKVVVETEFVDGEEILDEAVDDAGRIRRSRIPPSRRPPEVRAKAVSASVEAALGWLKAHQSPSGAWDASAFGRWCDGDPVTDREKQADGAGKAHFTPGVTGLALFAFLAAGYGPRGDHPYAETIGAGLRYLKNIQDPEGCIGARTSPSFIYNHAMGTIALVEAYALTESPLLAGAAQRALDFTEKARNPYFGWRYGVKPGDNDTSVTHWMLFGLSLAKRVNDRVDRTGRVPPFNVDSGAFEGAIAWIDKMTDADYGRVGYITRGSGVARPKELLDRFPGEKSEAMTAAGIHIRQMAGQNEADHAVIGKGLELMRRLPPTYNATDGSIDMYYWTIGTIAMRNAGGRPWREWSRRLIDAIVPWQRMDTDACGYKGSWDPVGPWGPDGGRVYSTAMMTIALSSWLAGNRAGDR